MNVHQKEVRVFLVPVLVPVLALVPALVPAHLCTLLLVDGMDFLVQVHVPLQVSLVS